MKRRIILPKATIFYSVRELIEGFSNEEYFLIFDYIFQEMGDPDNEIMIHLMKNYREQFYYFLAYPEDYIGKNIDEIAKEISDLSVISDNEMVINLKTLCETTLGLINSEVERRQPKLLKSSNLKTEE